MKRKLLIALIILVSINTYAQDKYVVFLKDKNNNPYSVNNPSQFLSQRSIDRRARYNIPVIEQDLPVTPAYVTGIANTGAIVFCRSKWFNTVTVEADTSEIIAVGALSYVDSYKKVIGVNIPKGINKSKFEEAKKISGSAKTNASTYWGLADSHIELINGKPLHNMGFKGEGMLIAVLDAGFPSVDNHFLFDSLRNDNRIKGTYDFVFNSPYVYHESGHGTAVLSLMAGKDPNNFVGTAPDANYILIHTEDDRNGSEYIIEEYNWVSGAEYADSMGADVLNTSLGYTTFNAASQDHTYADMNGVTAPITIGADIAFTKGMLIVNSAGNSGNSSWHYISAPADGINVMAIGSTDSTGVIAGYSSHGPTSDNRVKPNVSGQGSDCFFADQGGGYGQNSGTSFSGPIIAGMSACLWQAFPNRTNAQIKSAIEQSADRYLTPDDDYGYGIPDFGLAYTILFNTGIEPDARTQKKLILKNIPFKDQLEFDYIAGEEKEINVKVMDMMGRIIFDQTYPVSANTNNHIPSIHSLSTIAAGIYIININSNQSNIAEKILKY
jgi:serine protease AprX